MLLICAVLLAGCGGSGTHPTPRHHEIGGTPGSPTAPRGATGTAGARPLTAFEADLVTESGLQPFGVTIFDLRRDGPFLVLDFGLRCRLPGVGPGTGCGTGTTFTGPNLTGWDDTHNLRVPSGVWLVDPAADLEHRPVTDAAGQRPFTSQLPTSIDDGRLHFEWVRYSAPATDVTALDVVFPNGGPQIPDVPITSGPPPVPVAGEVSAQPASFPVAPGATSLTGLTSGVRKLTLSVVSRTGSDTESANRSGTTLRADVLFRFGKASLTPAARTILSSVAGRIKSRAAGEVVVTGYTDSVGSEAVNLPLSRRRAQAVVRALAPLTPRIAYHAAGEGSANPVAPNTTRSGGDDPAGRALNRRVTIAYAVRRLMVPTPPPAPASPVPTGVTAHSITFALNNPVYDSTWTATPLALFREGNLLVLHMTVTCTHSTNAGGSCNSEIELASAPTVPPLSLLTLGQSTTDRAVFFTIDAFSLLDPSTGEQYVTLHSSDTHPLTARLDSPLTTIGAAYQTWAYFPAPPGGASSMTLVTPAGTRLTGVPIAPAPAHP